MPETTDETTKKNPDATLPAGIELTPVSCEYVGADEVLVSLKTNAGDTVTYSLTTASMMQQVNMSVALINSFTGQVFRDLDVF